jgi:hypothetical protein
VEGSLRPSIPLKSDGGNFQYVYVWMANVAGKWCRLTIGQEVILFALCFGQETEPVWMFGAAFRTDGHSEDFVDLKVELGRGA